LIFANEYVDFVLRWFVLYFSMFIKLGVSFALTSFLPFPPPIHNALSLNFVKGCVRNKFYVTKFCKLRYMAIGLPTTK
jgi:hypothetical protein